MRENLLIVARDFVRRSRTHSQAEDFFTEVLAALLRLSSRFRDEFLGQVLGNSLHPVDGLSSWEITTQEEAVAEGTKYGVPDIVFEGAEAEKVEPSCLIAVEVKLDATLRSDQLARYDAWLHEKRRDYELVFLSALTSLDTARYAEHEARDELNYWSSWIRWDQVEEMLSSLLEEQTAHGERVKQESQERRDAFRVYGDAFASLLVDEGLVSPTPLRPVEDAALLQVGGTGQLEDRQSNRARLLHQALRDCGVLDVLRERKVTWHAMRARDGLPHRTQHHDGVQLRQRYQAGSFRGVFLSFGLAYHAQGWLLREGEAPGDLEHLNLTAALEVWDERGDKEANQLSRVMSGEGRLVRPVDELRDQLNEKFELEDQVFVPDAHFWRTKLVCRRSTNDLVGATKEAQELEIGGFFYAFVDAFEKVDGDALGYPEMSLLSAIEKFLGSVSP